jgi:hypothetical protein
LITVTSANQKTSTATTVRKANQRITTIHQRVNLLHYLIGGLRKMRTEKLLLKCTCGAVDIVKVAQDDLDNWHQGANVQDAFPYLSADQREMLIGNTCPVCWDKLMGPEEDDQPEEIDTPPTNGGHW